jgi:hypothetical protein
MFERESLAVRIEHESAIIIMDESLFESQAKTTMKR